MRPLCASHRWYTESHIWLPSGIVITFSWEEPQLRTNLDCLGRLQRLLRRDAHLPLPEELLGEVGDVSSCDGNVLYTAANYITFGLRETRKQIQAQRLCHIMWNLIGKYKCVENAEIQMFFHHREALSTSPRCCVWPLFCACSAAATDMLIQSSSP